MSNNNKPVSEVRDGTMKIAIFKNEPKEEGDRPWFSGKLTRSYKDANGDWHDTEYLTGSDYLRAARLMEKAYDAELAQRKLAREESPEPQA